MEIQVQQSLNTHLKLPRPTLFKNEDYLTSIKQIKGELSLTQYLGLQFDDIPPPSADKIRGGGIFLVILYRKSSKLCTFCRLQNRKNVVYLYK